MFAVGCEPLVYIRMQAAQMHLRWCNCAWWDCSHPLAVRLISGCQHQNREHFCGRL